MSLPSMLLVNHRTKVLALLTSAIALGTGSSTQGHLPHGVRGSKPAVTQGGPGVYRQQLRVGSDSRYGSAVAHAIKVWSEVDGAVAITPANGGPADVLFTDLNNCNKHAARYRAWRRDIFLNICKLDGQSEAVRNSVAAHELGHALGLPHLGRASQTDRRLMAKKQFGQVTAPQPVDIQHYRQAWGKSPGQTGVFKPHRGRPQAG